MTASPSNVGTGLDPALLVETLDDLAPPAQSTVVGTGVDESPSPADLGRTLGRQVGRSLGEAMGAEIGAILAPLLSGADDLEERYSGTSGARENVASNAGAGDYYPDRDTRADDDESTGDEREPEAEPGDRDGEAASTDDRREDDGPTAAQTDDRDAWGRRKVGIDWPLPPESRLPMDS